MVTEGTVDSQTIRKIQTIRARFFHYHQPEKIFSLSDIPQFQYGDTLFNPASVLPQTHKYPYRQVQFLYSGMKTCRWSQGLRYFHRELAKAVFWHQYLCGQIDNLPDGFFETTPFVHPMGSTYALQAVKSGRKEFLKQEFLQKIKDFVHIKELPHFSDPGLLNDSQKIVADFDVPQLNDLLEAKPLLISQNYLLYKVDQADSSTLPRYAVYPRKQWDDYLTRTGFQTHLDQGDFSIYKEGNIAWNVDKEFLESQSTRYKMLAGMCALMLSINVLWMIFLEIKRKVKEQQERLFVLQTLTHELRTPVTAMQLNLEPFRTDFDKLGQDGQRAFLRMADSIRRLNKVIQASTQYLKSSQDEGAMKFHLEYQPDIDELVDYLLEDYRERVKLDLEASQSPVEVDTYWFGMCLKNLVDNALKHGTPPVTVKTEASGEFVFVHVVDQGNVSESEFRRFLSPFSRKSKEEGLGLGLTLVKRVVDQMGAKLSFSSNPTTVTIRMKRSYEQITTD